MKDGEFDFSVKTMAENGMNVFSSCDRRKVIFRGSE